MQRILFTLVIILFTISACAPATESAIATAAATQPIITDEPPATQPADNSIPSTPNSPASANLSRGNVYIDSIELLTMESYPLQFTLLVRGNLPTPCHKLKTAVLAPNAENKISVGLYSFVDPQAICIQVLEPFEENIPLGSFPAGHYTLWVNGKLITEFDA